MAQTFSGTLHLSSSTVPTSGFPLSLVAWVNNAGGQGRRIIELTAGASESTGVLGLILDIVSATNKVSSYRASSVTNNQALTSTALTTGSWQHCGMSVTSSSAAASYLNGGSKGTASSTISPATLDHLLISGRQPDFAFGIGGQAAHVAAWARALSDTEFAYLGIGGNPRAIKSCVSYWKIASPGGTPESPVVDQIGTNNLTASGTMGAGTSDPAFQTFLTGSSVGAQGYTQGTAITSLNLAAGGTYFDDVSSAFTVTLQQATSTATTSTTTSSSGTTLREIPMTSVTGFTAGDYIKIGSNAITRLLGVNSTAVTLLVATDQTYSASATVTRYAVNPLTVSGLSISSNVFSGTPTVASTQNNCFFRATCNGNSALMGDSDVFTITVTASGGGGSGTGIGAGGIFNGGFSGG